jgi:uncharacterized cupin superfamily protein
MPERSKGADPIPPFSVESVPWQEWAKGERFGSRYRALTDRGGGSRVGVAIEELPPGRQSCPAHYHLLEEEHLLVLAGQATLRLGEGTYEVRAGDYVCFPAGQKAAHALINHGTEPCRFLIVGERNPNDVIVYPDSGKTHVRLLDANYRIAATLDYWEGEAVDAEGPHPDPPPPAAGEGEDGVMLPRPRNVGEA